MSQASLDVDELGPVDWILVEFPGSKFSGEIAPQLEPVVVAHGVNRRMDRREERRDRRF